MGGSSPTSRRQVLTGAAAAGAILATTGLRAGATGLPVLTVGTLAQGTVAWELQTIRAHGFDTANGFSLETRDFAGNPATQIALQGGAVDAIVTDWLWAAQANARGLALTFLPYSTAVGGLMVRGDSPVRALADLDGAAVAVAGGPVDKSWLILRALGARQGFDLAARTRQVFAAPPLVMQAALSGEVQGAVNFWHFMAKMAARGMREVVSVAEAAQVLGLDPGTPLLGYAVALDRVADRPQLVAALARASRDAKMLLARDPAAWQALRPLMGAESEAEFAALRDGFRAGIPPDRPVDAQAAGRLFEVLAEVGGDRLTGGLTALPPGLFYAGT